VLTLTLVKCFKNANTRAHKLYTFWLAIGKQGRSGHGLEKRKGGVWVGPDAGLGVDLCIRYLTLGGATLGTGSDVDGTARSDVQGPS
jgi:hypothetical protein